MEQLVIEIYIHGNVLPGPISVMAPFTLLAGVLTFIWPFVHGIAGYVVVAIIYGCVPRLTDFLNVDRNF